MIRATMSATISPEPKLAARDYFEQTPDVLGGKLRLRGTRVSIEQVLELLEAGVTPEEIVQSFPSVTLNAIAAVERFAARCALAGVR
jgi:uncharacterized protein (DUF433 family)